MAQERLWRHQDQRLAEGAVQLAAQDVEVVGGCRAVGDDPVVLATLLQEALKAGRASALGLGLRSRAAEALSDPTCAAICFRQMK